MRTVSTARILICNDDGINAPGIALLEKVAHTLSDDIWVIAPENEQSGAGHSLTLTKPLRIRKLGDKRFAINGTPTDCIMMALNQIMPDSPPTLILSGVNRGGNLAEDVTYSGTVSVAMEGTLGKVPSIALSQCIRPGQKTNWQSAERYAADIITRLVAEGWPEDVLMNVNFPAVDADDVKGVHVTCQGRREVFGSNVEERVDPRGFRYYWFGLGREVGDLQAESDLKAVRTGYISITPLHLDLTHHETRSKMTDALTQSF